MAGGEMTGRDGVALGTVAITPATLSCPRCGTAFTPRRKDQRFCSRPCAKKATHNATRGPRLIADSAEARRVHEFRKGRVKGLSDALYETPPAYRAEFMERLIKEASGKSELRQLVTGREMLRSWARDEGTGRLHIAHVLDHYCREVYGLRSYEAVDPKAVLPSAVALAFPSEYFGPDAPPIYEDGSLKERPCSWETWKEMRKKSLHHYKENQHRPMPEYVRVNPVAFLSQLRRMRAGETTAQAA